MLQRDFTPQKVLTFFPPNILEKDQHMDEILHFETDKFGNTHKHLFEANLFLYAPYTFVFASCLSSTSQSYCYLFGEQLWRSHFKLVDTKVALLRYIFIPSSLLSYIFPHQVAKLGHSPSEQSPKHQKNPWPLQIKASFVVGFVFFFPTLIPPEFID